MTGAQGATRCAVASAHTLQAGPSLAGSATEADLRSLRGRPRLSAYLPTYGHGKQGKYTRYYGPFPAGAMPLCCANHSRPSRAFRACNVTVHVPVPGSGRHHVRRPCLLVAARYRYQVLLDVVLIGPGSKRWKGSGTSNPTAPRLLFRTLQHLPDYPGSSTEGSLPLFSLLCCVSDLVPNSGQLGSDRRTDGLCVKAPLDVLTYETTSKPARGHQPHHVAAKYQ
ncbi:hypothetical protein V8C44DRAFT_120453 [Trichoderma aethiopicum]